MTAKSLYELSCDLNAELGLSHHAILIPCNDQGLLNTSNREIKAEGSLWTSLFLNCSRPFKSALVHTVSEILEYDVREEKNETEQWRIFCNEAQRRLHLEIPCALAIAFPEGCRGTSLVYVSCAILLGEQRRKSTLDVTFTSHPLIFSTYFPFKVAGKVCSGIVDIKMQSWV